MVISRNNECPHINIFFNGNKLKDRDQFKYLGTLISSHRGNNTEIGSRITQAKKSFQRMKSILTNNHILIQTRRALEGYIEPILMYGYKPRQFQNKYKRIWRQQKCDSFGECYESHGLQRNQRKQCYKKPTQQDHS